MPMWKVIPPRRDYITESVELVGTTQQALVEQSPEGIIVSISLLLSAGATVDDGKGVSERMIAEARRLSGESE